MIYYSHYTIPMKKLLPSRSVSVAFLTLLSLSLSTHLLMAQGLRDFNDVTRKFTFLGNAFLDVLIFFAVIWIVFNVVRYLIVGADSEEKRKTARQAIIWGIIGLAIILSIWGLVNVVLKTFRFNDNNTPVQQFPTIPVRNGTSPRGSGTGGSGTGGGTTQPQRPVLPGPGIYP